MSSTAGTMPDPDHTLFQTAGGMVATLGTVFHTLNHGLTRDRSNGIHAADLVEFDGCPDFANQPAHGRPMLPSEWLVSLIPSDC
jgi:hypothetical protein